MTTQAFAPAGVNKIPPNAQASLAVGTSVGVLPLPDAPVGANPFGQSVRILVDGTDKVFWQCDSGSQLNVNNGVPMLGNTVEIFTIPAGTKFLAFVSTGAGSTVRVTLGDGV